MYYDKEIDRDMVVYKDAGVYYAPEHRSQDIDVTIDGKVYVTDNIFIEISPECSKDLPETYKGISGGGCWEIYLDKALNCICICLIGVQVAQFPPIRPYQLWCKGPKTITALFSHSQSF